MPEGPLIEHYDVGLFDLDGVIYRVADPVEHASEAIAAARTMGMRPEFVTNNASRSVQEVAALLASVGVSAQESEIVTAAQATAALLAEELARGARVLVVGSVALAAELAAAGLTTVDSADEKPRAVVQGFDPEVGWAQLAEATVAIGRGARWIATNGDTTLPSPRGVLPGNGALVAAVATAVGRQPDVIVGKPHPRLHQEAVRRSGARHPLVIGDRLDTDIAGAHAAGCDSLLVMTGVTSPAMLLVAEPGHRPTFIAADLRGLVETHVPARWVAGGLALGGWRASDSSCLVLRGEGDPIDALRVLCQLAWSRPVGDVTVAAVGQPAVDAVRSLGLRYVARNVGDT